MLIIAIPKSAGTSLSMTLAKLHNLEFDEGLTHYNQIKNGNIIELRHGSMGNVKKGDIKKFKNEKIIYHEHLFPTKDNIKNLKNQKKVILLREPEEILHSWWRAEQSGIHSKHPMLKNKPLFKEKQKKSNQKNLLKKEKKEVNKFILLTAVIVFSGTFFGNIDKIMLGKFVIGEFIGYYQAAFSLIGALTSFSAFGAVLLPIFSRMKKESLDRAMKKTIRVTLLISTGVFAAALIFSYLAILIIYGREYFLAINILRILTILIFILPLTGIYVTYFMSENKPEIIVKSLVFSTILNIILNYILITTLLQFGEIFAVYGASISTIVSQGAYLGILAWRMQRKNKGQLK